MMREKQACRHHDSACERASVRLAAFMSCKNNQMSFKAGRETEGHTGVAETAGESTSRPATKGRIQETVRWWAAACSGRRDGQPAGGYARDCLMFYWAKPCRQTDRQAGREEEGKGSIACGSRHHATTPLYAPCMQAGVLLGHGWTNHQSHRDTPSALSTDVAHCYLFHQAHALGRLQVQASSVKAHALANKRHQWQVGCCCLLASAAAAGPPAEVYQHRGSRCCPANNVHCWVVGSEEVVPLYGIKGYTCSTTTRAAKRVRVHSFVRHMGIGMSSTQAMLSSCSPVQYPCIYGCYQTPAISCLIALPSQQPSQAVAVAPVSYLDVPLSVLLPLLPGAAGPCPLQVC